MSYHDVEFPDDLSYSTAVGPMAASSIVETDSGIDETTARWSAPHYLLGAEYVDKNRDTAYIVLTFYNARNGAANSFRIKNWLDFASTANGRTDPVAVSNVDQQIGIGNGTQTDFQLVKRYTSGGETTIRNVTKPKSGTVVIAFDGTNQSSGWTVNLATGIVTFTTAPGVSVVVTAGFQYFFEVRFDSVIDAAGLLGKIEHFDHVDLPRLPMREVVGTALINDDFPYRGSYFTGFAADMTISFALGAVQVLTPTGGGLSAKLPVNVSMPRGGTIGWIVNPSAFSFALKTSSGSAVCTVPAASGGVASVTEVILGDVSGTPTWFTF